MAGDPLFDGGAWTADACQKIIRFVDLAETFHFPLVHLVDCPGFQVGLAAERSAVIRWGVRAIAAICQTSVPWCSVIVRNVLRRRRAGPPAGRAAGAALRLAVGELGLPAAGRRHRGGLPRRRSTRSADPAAKLDEIEARLNRAALPVPYRRSRSGWRRSSTRATPAGCCASSPSWRRRCARRAWPHSACGPERGCPSGRAGARGYRRAGARGYCRADARGCRAGEPDGGPRASCPHPPCCARRPVPQRGRGDAPDVRPIPLRCRAG